VGDCKAGDSEIPKTTISKMYTAIGTYLVYGSLSFWVMTQTKGLHSFLGIEIPSGKSNAVVALFGITYLSLPFVFVLLLVLYWHKISTESEVSSFQNRLPTLWGLDLGGKSVAAHKFQSLTFLCLVVFPMAAQIHFVKKMTNEGGIYSVSYCDGAKGLEEEEPTGMDLFSSERLHGAFDFYNFTNEFIKNERHLLNCEVDYTFPLFLVMSFVLVLMLVLFGKVLSIAVGISAPIALGVTVGSVLFFL